MFLFPSFLFSTQKFVKSNVAKSMVVKNRNPGLERISTCLLFFSRFSSDISSGGGLTEYFFESNTFSIRRFPDDLFDHWEAYLRVATAQGKQEKQGIWFLLFPDRENTGNFALTQGKNLRHRENIFL